MNKSEAIKRLTAVFRKVFDDDSIVLSDNTSALDIEGWDSFEHVNLMLSVEEEFGVHISMEQATAIKNVGELVNILVHD